MKNALTPHEVADISTALDRVTRLSNKLEGILLGDIPIIDEDGIEILGHLRQDEGYNWTFVPVGQDFPSPGSAYGSTFGHVHPALPIDLASQMKRAS